MDIFSSIYVPSLSEVLFIFFCCHSIGLYSPLYSQVTRHAALAIGDENRKTLVYLVFLSLCFGMMLRLEERRGQLGYGHLTDFALTSGRPIGVWHANRLMSLFKCKFVGGSLEPHPVNSHKRNTSHTIRRRVVFFRRSWQHQANLIQTNTPPA